MADDITTKAAIAAGRRAVKGAVDDLLLSDEEKAKRTAAEARAAKTRRTKYIAIAVLGLILVIGVVGLVLSYWYWFLLAGILGVAGFLGWQKLKGDREEKAEARSTEESRAKVVAAPKPKVRVADEEFEAPGAPEKNYAEKLREEASARAKAQAEARAVQEAEVDEELAKLKARVKR